MSIEWDGMKMRPGCRKTRCAGLVLAGLFAALPVTAATDEACVQLRAPGTQALVDALAIRKPDEIAAAQ